MEGATQNTPIQQDSSMPIPSTEEGAKTEPTQNEPDDIAIDQAQLKLLEEELAQTQNSVDADFIKEFQSSLTPEEQELQFGDVNAFLSLYEERKQAYLETKINEKKQKIDGLKGKIIEKLQDKEIGGARKEFLRAHPDADLKSMRDFFENDLPPRKQKEINALPLKELYEALYAEWKKSGGGGEKEGEKVPLRVEGAFGKGGSLMSGWGNLWERNL